MRMPAAHSAAFPERPRHAAPAGICLDTEKDRPTRLARSQPPLSAPCKTFTRQLSLPRSVRKPHTAHPAA